MFILYKIWAFESLINLITISSFKAPQKYGVSGSRESGNAGDTGYTGESGDSDDLVDLWIWIQDLLSLKKLMTIS